MKIILAKENHNWSRRWSDWSPLWPSPVVTWSILSEWQQEMTGIDRRRIVIDNGWPSQSHIKMHAPGDQDLNSKKYFRQIEIIFIKSVAPTWRQVAKSGICYRVGIHKCGLDESNPGVNVHRNILNSKQDSCQMHIKNTPMYTSMLTTPRGRRNASELLRTNANREQWDMKCIWNPTFSRSKSAVII